MEVHFLGTGAGVPARHRNVSALALRFLNEAGDVWLFDCGEATQHQFLRSPLSLASISTIFISHLHGDHLLGLPGLLSSRSFQGGETPVTIYGPKGLKEFIHQSLETTKTKLRYELVIDELKEGFLFENEWYEVDTLSLIHPVESFAFRIKEKERPGALHVEKLKALGIAPGPIYAQLKQGKRVTLDDGQTIDGRDFVDAPLPGRTVVIAGDTAPVEKMDSFAANADLLVHEATFASDQQGNAHAYGHSTIADACGIAKRANVKKVVLTHVSSRYSRNEDVYLHEVEKQFPGAIVAYDLFVLKLAKTRGAQND
ncbi:ribonuclease Z [Shouchella patagoniensis]|uniref:ribonuclease Z n=1 Tax=Shouchella patagoniensis TaxID=228576 RepID=UPI000995700A|nr:ribonuclease Z [Shouchella patagoniensis]